MNHYRIEGALGSVVLSQPFAQPARLRADYAVDLGVVARIAVEESDADGRFFQTRAIATQRRLDDEAEKRQQALRISERPARVEALQGSQNVFRRFAEDRVRGGIRTWGTCIWRKLTHLLHA